MVQSSHRADEATEEPTQDEGRDHERHGPEQAGMERVGREGRGECHERIEDQEPLDGVPVEPRRRRHPDQEEKQRQEDALTRAPKPEKAHGLPANLLEPEASKINPTEPHLDPFQEEAERARIQAQ